MIFLLLIFQFVSLSDVDDDYITHLEASNNNILHFFVVYYFCEIINTETLVVDRLVNCVVYVTSEHMQLIMDFHDLSSTSTTRF